MKRSLFLTLTLCLAIGIQAQTNFQSDNQVYTATISRDMSYPFLISSDSGNISVLSDGDGGGMLLEGMERYEYDYGHGRKKDRFGYKEKHKRYLVSGEGKQLLTYYREKGKFHFQDNSWLFTRKTQDGWAFINETGERVAWLNLYSNPTDWKMELTTTKSSENIETLKKFLFMAMPMWAYQAHMDQQKAENRIGLSEVTDLMFVINRL